MELQIQDLVASIKRDGIEEGEKQAKAIIDNAKAEAERILAEAKGNATKLVTDAKKEIAVLDQSVRASLQQAARDVSLSLKKELTTRMEAVLETEVAALMTGEQLVNLVAKVITSVDPSKTVVEISEKEFNAVSAMMKNKLASALQQGLEIRPVDSVNVGFRLADKDGSGFYDLSAEEVASLMVPFLSTSIQQLLFEKN